MIITKIIIAIRKKKISNANKGELFYFDPSTIIAADWQRPGIRDKTISTIHNYFNKGGTNLKILVK